MTIPELRKIEATAALLLVEKRDLARMTDRELSARRQRIDELCQSLVGPGAGYSPHVMGDLSSEDLAIAQEQSLRRHQMDKRRVSEWCPSCGQHHPAGEAQPGYSCD